MIITSNVFRAFRFALPIAASSLTGRVAAREREILQRRAAKTVTVAHRQARALDDR